MKKIISLPLTLMLCFAMLVSLTSCSFKHPIEEFRDKLENANNYLITMTMYDIPLIGTVTMTQKVDGNIRYTAPFLLEDEYYTEQVGNVLYKYTQNTYGIWRKIESKTGNNSYVLTDEMMQELFNPDNFEAVKGEKKTYKQKSSVVFDGMDEVVITLDGKGCMIEMTAISEGISCHTKIVINKIGEISITLPVVD